MKPARPVKRLSTVALVMLGWIVVGLAAPLVMSFQRGEIEIHPPMVSAAPRDSFVIANPIQLSGAPSVLVDRGVLQLVNPSGKQLTGEASAALLASGNARLLLDGGSLQLRLSALGEVMGVAADEAQSSPIAGALARQAFEALILRKTWISAALPDGRTEIISEVNGELSIKRKGPLVLKGMGQLRGQSVSFEVTSAQAGDAKSAGKPLPLKVQFKSGPLEATIDGALNSGPKSGFLGQLDAAVPRVRNFARWFGGGWPIGPGLRDLKLKGALDWSERGLAVQNAQISMDGNEATGAVLLKFTGQRPSLAGTVAYKSLSLQPYFAASQPSAMRLSTWWNWLTGGDLSSSLVRLIDADLRISADKVLASGVEIGRTAAAMTIADGRLLTNIADLEFKGGAGSGQISIDYAVLAPKVVVRGKIDGIEAAGIVESVVGAPVLSGPASIVADLTANGMSLQQLMRSATGKLGISLRSGGRIGIDIKALLAAAQKRELDGWAEAPRGYTTIDQLDVKLAIRNGEIAAERVEIGSGDAAMIASGAVNVATGWLDARVTMGPAATASGKPDALLLNGAMAAPRIRSEAASRAAQPTPERASQTRG